MVEKESATENDRYDSNKEEVFYESERKCAGSVYLVVENEN